MIKYINYFFQSIIIYIFFFIGCTLGLANSRKVFSNLFKIIGPIFKSKKTINKNLDIFSSEVPNINKEKIIKNCGIIMEKLSLSIFFKEKCAKITLFYNYSWWWKFSKIIKKNKPIIFVSVHFANFELMSMEFEKNIKLATVADL